MPRLRRPQQTVVSGLGMAGAVLASAVLTFAVASGIVTYSLTSEDPMATSSSALVLNLAAGPPDAPLVLRAARSPRAVRERAAAAAARAAAAAPGEVRGLADGALSVSSHRDSGGAPNAGASAPASEGLSRQPVTRPVGKALGQTTQAVGATTDSLGRRLAGVTDNLAPVTQQTGVLLQTIAERTNATLDRLLRKR